MASFLNLKMLLPILFFLALQAQLSFSLPSRSGNFLSATPIADDDASVFDMAKFQQGIPVMRRHHHHVNRRDLHHEIFEPKQTLTMDFLQDQHHIQTITLSHDNASYVNLDSLHAHSLFRDSDQPMCSRSTKTKSTVMYLRFRGRDSYELAKKHWSGKDRLLFAINDPSCNEDLTDGNVAVVRGDKMTFHDRPGKRSPLIRIEVAHHELSVLNPELATTISVSQESFRRLSKRNDHALELVEDVNRRDQSSKLEIFPDILSDLKSEISDWESDSWSDVHDIDVIDRLQALSRINADATFNVKMHFNEEWEHRITPLKDA
ncbi:hypothetical protein CC80DRAFT_574291 [Byssothecium circinans]|uniref:Uncharacterized protein n=1 Tax=Byssothecium circinans TaxID=147558 RepID=A0A6A5UKW1_9PLEO|nr:hypothetical protein CC80DRAFT_574291 [Byssothecium circinans]